MLLYEYANLGLSYLLQIVISDKIPEINSLRKHLTLPLLGRDI